ncbi:MAG: hypothetical protein IPL82_05475 [Elusimicrobia bacterium]|nr:hypothetical protein [Elusimicrobiota bacterium]
MFAQKEFEVGRGSSRRPRISNSVPAGAVPAAGQRVILTTQRSSSAGASPLRSVTSTGAPLSSGRNKGRPAPRAGW